MSLDTHLFGWSYAKAGTQPEKPTSPAELSPVDLLEAKDWVFRLRRQGNTQPARLLERLINQVTTANVSS